MNLTEKNETGPGPVNAECYVFPTNLLNKFPMNQPFSLENDFLAKAINEYFFYAFISKGRYPRV